MADDAQAGSPVVAVLMGLLVTVALAGTAYVVLAGIGGEERFHAAAVRLDSSDGELHMDLLSGQVEMDQSYLMISVDGAEPERVALNSLSDQTGDPLQWRAGNPLCIVGSDPDCLYDQGAEVDVQLITGESRIFDRTEAVVGGQRAAPDGQGDDSVDDGDESGNVAPTASFAIASDGYQASADGSASSDDDGDALAFDWDFGDGQTATGLSPQHTYASAGTYTVTLTTSDGRGGSDTTTQQITISDPAYCNGFEDMDGDLVFTAGTDAPLDAEALADGEHRSRASLVVPACHGPIQADDKVELRADLHILIDVNITSSGAKVEIDAKNGTVALRGATISAYDKVEVDSGDDMVVTADLQSTTNKVDLRAGGSLTADRLQIDARDDIDLEAAGALSAKQTTLTSQSDAIGLKAGGVLTADGSQLSAQKKITLEGCPVSVLDTILDGSNIRIKEC